MAINKATFNINDIIKVTSNIAELERLHKNHGGGWVDAMKNIPGLNGYVRRIYDDGDVSVELENGSVFKLNSLALNSNKPTIGPNNSTSSAPTSNSRTANSPAIRNLYAAIEKNDMNRLKSALRTGLSVKNSYNDTTPLHAACNARRSEMVEYILLQGTDPNTKDARGKTPLQYCIDNQNPDINIVKLLLDNKADPNDPGKILKYPLIMAITQYKSEVVSQLLLSAKCNPNIFDSRNYALHCATTHSNPEMIVQLLDAGADPELVNNKGFLAIHMGITGKNRNVVNCMLERRPSLVNVKCSKGSPYAGLTPLHLALLKDQYDIVTDLVSSTCIDLEQQDDELALTPFLYTVNKKQFHMLDILFQAGCNFYATDEFKNNALHFLSQLRCDDYRVDQLNISSQLLQVYRDVKASVGASDVKAAVCCYLVKIGVPYKDKNTAGEEALSGLDPRYRDYCVALAPPETYVCFGCSNRAEFKNIPCKHVTFCTAHKDSICPKCQHIVKHFITFDPITEKNRKNQQEMVIDFNQCYQLNATCRGIAVIAIFGNPRVYQEKLEKEIGELCEVLSRLKFECAIITSLSNITLTRQLHPSLLDTSDYSINSCNDLTDFINERTEIELNYSSLLFYAIGEKSQKPENTPAMKFTLSNEQTISGADIVDNLNEVLSNKPKFFSFQFIENSPELSSLDNTLWSLEDTYICYFAQEKMEIGNPKLALHAVINFLCKELKEYKRETNFIELFAKINRNVNSEFSKSKKTNMKDFILLFKNSLKHNLYLDYEYLLLRFETRKPSIDFRDAICNSYVIESSRPNHGIALILKNYTPSTPNDIQNIKNNLLEIREVFENKNFKIEEKTLNNMATYKEILNFVAEQNDFDCLIVVIISSSNNLDSINISSNTSVPITKFCEDLSNEVPKCIPKVFIFSQLLQNSLWNALKTPPHSPIIFENYKPENLRDVFISQSVTCNDADLNTVPLPNIAPLFVNKYRIKEIHSIIQLSKDQYINLYKKNIISFQEIDCLRRDFFLVPQNNQIESLLANRSEELNRAFKEACEDGKAMFRFLRLMVVGPEGVGKTCLLNSLKGKPFNENEQSTLILDKFDFQANSLTHNWKDVQKKNYEDIVDDRASELAIRNVVSKLSINIKESQETQNFEVVLESQSNQQTEQHLNQPKQEVVKVMIEEKSTDKIMNVPDMQSNNSSSNNTTSTPPSFNNDNQAQAQSSESASDNNNSITTMTPDIANTPTASAVVSTNKKFGTRDRTNSFARQRSILSMDRIKEKLTGIDEEDNNVDMFTAWDFAGQVYLYCFHSLFLAPRAIYLLLIDLCVDELTDDIVSRSERKDEYVARDHRCQGGVPKTYMETISFWMRAIYYASSSSMSRKNKKKRLTAKVLLVFSRADKVENPMDKAYNFTKKIKQHFSGNNQILDLLYDNLKEPFIVSCNPKSSYFTKLQELKTIISEISEVVDFSEEIPIRWLKFVKLILKSESPILSHENVVELAKQANCNNKLSELLRLFHEIGFFFLHDDIVIKDIRPFLDLLYHIITPTACTGASQNDLDLCEQEGKMNIYLLEEIFKRLKLESVKIELKAILEQYGVLINHTDSKNKTYYYVPYLLRENLTYDDSHQPQTEVFKYVIYFPDGFIPASVYFALLSRMIDRSNQGKYMHNLGLDMATFHLANGVTYTIDFFKSKSYIRLLFRCPAKSDAGVKSNYIIRLSQILFDIQIDLVRIQATSIPCGRAAKIAIDCNCHLPEEIVKNNQITEFEPKLFMEQITALELITDTFQCCEKNCKCHSNQPFKYINSSCVNALKNLPHAGYISEFLNKRTELLEQLNWQELAPYLFKFGLVDTNRMQKILEPRFTLSEEFVTYLCYQPNMFTRLYLALDSGREDPENENVLTEIIDHLNSVQDTLRYPMRQTGERGIALIMNNRSFDDPETNPSRDGSQLDYRRLIMIFNQFRYRIINYEDKTAEECKDILKNIRKNEISDEHDSFICVMMSHGVGDDIIFKDGCTISKDYIVSSFHLSNCPLLTGKPKIFIFQACRGDYEESIQTSYDSKTIESPIEVKMERNTNSRFQTDKGISETTSKSSKKVKTQESIEELKTQPIKKDDSNFLVAESSDIYIGYGTLADHASFRGADYGSFYIQALCGVMEERGDEEFLQIMKQTRSKVLEICLKQADFDQVNLTEGKNFFKRDFYLK